MTTSLRGPAACLSFAIIVWVSLLSVTKASGAYMAIDSLSGPITTNEIASFKNYMATEVPPETPWGDLNGTGHNAWCDFWAGTDLEAMSMMYEATGDIAILNKLVSWVDTCVSQRNDLMSAANGGQRICWDGVIDKTWVAQNLNDLAQTGCEGGDTEAHIAYCAKLILQNPSIWNTTVPDGNPYGYGVTYLDRAKTYIAKCDEANDQYLVKYFVEAGSNLIRDPLDSRWGGQSVAINRQAMFFRGFARLAECHELLGDSPSRVAQYDAIVNAAANECLSGIEHAQIVNSDTVYTWGYYPWSTTFNESTGHAQYDVFGIYAAFNRKGNVYGISRAEVNPIAETMIDLIDLGNNHFSGNVDGSGTSTSYLIDGWLTTADWDPQVYDIGAAADVASTRYRTTPSMEATILWMKNRRYLKFAVDASPASQTVTSGSSKTYTVTLTPMGAFSGTVTMSASGLPSGATASFSSSSINLATLNQAATSVTLTLSTSGSTPAGSYTITVTGTSGSVSHSDTVKLVVANYTVSASPASQTVSSGDIATYTATVGSVNGFAGTVSFGISGLPAGATASFSPSSVAGAGSATLTVATSSSTPPGTNTLTITGTSGSLSHSATVTLVVAPVPGSVNLALGKTATASTTWSSSYSAAQAVDGNDTSRWSAASGQTNNQWVLIDLGSAMAYDRVVIKEISYPRVTSFKVQSSTDGTTFTDVATGTTIGASNTVTFASVTARYVRLFIASAAGGPPTINEIQVFQDAQLFQNTSYGGWHANFLPGNYTAAQITAAGGVVDDASSLRVPAGFKVTLYTGDNFTGTSVVKTADDSSLVDDGVNDQVSSLKIELN